MYINYGYLNNSKMPFMDKSRPLIVGSCGTYRLSTKKKLPTWSPHGRVDYQLLYLSLCYPIESIRGRYRDGIKLPDWYNGMKVEIVNIYRK